LSAAEVCRLPVPSRLSFHPQRPTRRQSICIHPTREAENCLIPIRRFLGINQAQAFGAVKKTALNSQKAASDTIFGLLLHDQAR